MNVIVFASRKGGSGKSTLAAHLAAEAHKPSRPVLMIDADPQGSLALRPGDDLRLPAEERIPDAVRRVPGAGLPDRERRD